MTYLKPIPYLFLSLLFLWSCHLKESDPITLEAALQATPAAKCCEEARSFFAANPEAFLPDTLEEELTKYLAALDTATGTPPAIKALCRYDQAFQLSVAGQYIESNETGEAGLKLTETLPETEAAIHLLADYHNMIGVNYQRLFDIGKALAFSRNAELLYRRLEQPADVAKEKINQGVALYTIGKTAEAERATGQAWHLINRYDLFANDPAEQLAVKNLSANTLFTKAQQAYERGDLQGARLLHQHSIDTFQVIRQQLAAAEPRDVNTAVRLAGACFSIASNYGLRRIPAEADSLIRYSTQVRQIFDALGDYSWAPPYQYSYIIEAVGLAEKGAHRRAADRLMSGLNGLGASVTTVDEPPQIDAASLQFPQLVLNGIFNQARLLRKRYEQQGDPRDLQRALEVRKAALALMEQMRVNLVSEDPGQNVRAGIWNAFGEGIEDAMLLFEKTGNAQWKEEALRFAEQSKSFTLRQAVKQRFSSRSAQAPARSWFERERAIRNTIVRTREALAGAAETESQALYDQLLATYARYEAFLAELEESTEASAQQYYAERFDNTLPAVKQIQELLDDRTAILNYAMSGPTGWCFILTRDQFEAVPIDARGGAWSRWSRRLNTNLKPLGGTDIPELAHPLYEAVMAPARARLPANINRLVIVPDGDLWAVVFELLLTAPAEQAGAGPMPYLINDYAISYLPNLSTLDYLRRFPAPAPAARYSYAGFISRYTGLADINERSPRCNDRPLEDMARAIRGVNEKFKDAGYEHTMVNRATEADFVDRAGDFDIIQMAAHACIDNRDPIEYALLFSTDPDELEANMLTTGEIYQMEFKQTRLAVLSNCSTGAGEIQRGEGIASIARAFTYAGCPSLITAINDIPEEPTAEILDYFYDRVLEGMPLDIALQKARLAYLKKHPGKHPATWANLIVFGDVRPLGNPALQ